MPTRAMVVVAAGIGSRFGDDKLMADIAGRPLIEHTVRAVEASVGRCVVACRPEMMRDLEQLGLGVELVPGGPTRTSSEMAGIAAVGPGTDLIGIHDGARPAVSKLLIETLFQRAWAVGGAVPVLAPKTLFVDKESVRHLPGVVAVQTPQVFRGGELYSAFSQAAREGFTGHDTVEVVRRYTDLQIQSVPGDPANVKVTVPDDLESVRATLSDRPRT